MEAAIVPFQGRPHRIADNAQIILRPSGWSWSDLAPRQLPGAPGATQDVMNVVFGNAPMDLDSPDTGEEARILQLPSQVGLTTLYYVLSDPHLYTYNT